MEGMQPNKEVETAIMVLTALPTKRTEAEEKVENSAIKAIITVQQNIKAISPDQCSLIAKNIRSIGEKFEKVEKVQEQSRFGQFIIAITCFVNRILGYGSVKNSEWAKSVASEVEKHRP